MTPIRLGAVGYLNARPLVHTLGGARQFAIRYDVPSECARLLHARDTDLGLIPSIEYLRGPGERGGYRIVPDMAIGSLGPVASVALYTRRDPRDIRSIAMDTSSRTSIALATVIARRAFGVSVEPVAMPPDLEPMLARADAALIIGDNALFLDALAAGVTKIDLGEVWTATTGLPFVYAFWAGWPGVVSSSEVRLLQEARDQGVADSERVAGDYFPGDPARQDVGARYLRDNIRYSLGPDEIEGLKAFYRYAVELGLVAFDGTLRFYDVEHSAAR